MQVSKINYVASAKNEAVMNGFTSGVIMLVGYGYGMYQALKGAQLPLSLEAFYAVGFILLGAVAIIAIALCIGFVRGFVRAFLYNHLPQQLMPRLEVEIADEEFGFYSPEDLNYVTLKDGSHVAVSGLESALQKQQG